MEVEILEQINEDDCDGNNGLVLLYLLCFLLYKTFTNLIFLLLDLLDGYILEYVVVFVFWFIGIWYFGMWWYCILE